MWPSKRGPSTLPLPPLPPRVRLLQVLEELTSSELDKAAFLVPCIASAFAGGGAGGGGGDLIDRFYAGRGEDVVEVVLEEEVEEVAVERRKTSKEECWLQRHYSAVVQRVGVTATRLVSVGLVQEGVLSLQESDAALAGAGCLPDHELSRSLVNAVRRKGRDACRAYVRLLSEQDGFTFADISRDDVDGDDGGHVSGDVGGHVGGHEGGHVGGHVGGVAVTSSQHPRQLHLQPSDTTDNPSGTQTAPEFPVTASCGLWRPPLGLLELKRGQAGSPGGSRDLRRDPGGTRRDPGGTRRLPGGTRRFPGGTRRVPGGTRRVPRWDTAAYGVSYRRALAGTTLLVKKIFLDAESVAAFRRDVEIMSLVRHDHVVGLRGFNVDEGRLLGFLVLQFVRGRDLHSLIAHPLRHDELLRYHRGWMLQLCSVLWYLHSRQLTHGNVTTHNCLVALR
ncbi:uncharacterized protein LOC144952973 [Lampetra fluviatilis]